MREPLLAQFKVVHKHTESLLEAMRYDISRVEADFIKELESISTVLGALIERVEAGRPREPRYDDVYFEGLARLDADARGKTEDIPELKITGQDRTMCPYKICLKEKCEFYPNDCSVIRAHKGEVEP